MPDLIALAKQEIAKIGLVSADDVVDACVVRQPKAYPVYDEDYRDHMAMIRLDLEAQLSDLASRRPQRHAQVQQPGPRDDDRHADGARTSSRASGATTYGTSTRTRSITRRERRAPRKRWRANAWCRRRSAKPRRRWPELPKKRRVISGGCDSIGFARFAGDHDGLDRNHSTAICAGRSALRKRPDGYGVETDRAADAGAIADRAPAHDRAARGRERDPVHGVDGLSVAAIAKGFSAVFDRAGLFLRLVAQRPVHEHQSSAGDGGAREGGARGEPDRRRDRQPIGEDDGKRRSTRL